MLRRVNLDNVVTMALGVVLGLMADRWVKGWLSAKLGGGA